MIYKKQQLLCTCHGPPKSEEVLICSTKMVRIFTIVNKNGFGNLSNQSKWKWFQKFLKPIEMKVVSEISETNRNETGSGNIWNPSKLKVVSEISEASRKESGFRNFWNQSKWNWFRKFLKPIVDWKWFQKFLKPLGSSLPSEKWYSGCDFSRSGILTAEKY